MEDRCVQHVDAPSAVSTLVVGLLTLLLTPDLSNPRVESVIIHLFLALTQTAGTDTEKQSFRSAEKVN